VPLRGRDRGAVAEPGADLLGVRVVEVGEDRQCCPPAVPGRAGVSAGVVGVAEVDQRVRFVVPGAQVAEQRERLVVAGDGVGVPAQWGSAAALRQMIGELADCPALVRVVGWSSWRPYSRACGVVVAVAYLVTVVLASLDQAGVWSNAPSGLTERVALIAGLGWCASLAGRLPAATAARPLRQATMGGQA
jgi:hypothetical protein